MRTISFIFLISANSLYAGTAGNSDLKLALLFLLLLCGLLLGIEKTIQYIRNRRLRKQEEMQMNISEEDHSFL